VTRSGTARGAEASSGPVLELTIEKPAAGGRMLARHDGRIVLVQGAIPGERVRVRVSRTGKGVAYADTIEVLIASSDRRPAHDPRCGGQALAHVVYSRQVRLKGEVIQDGLARIGKITLAAAPAVVPSPERGYRMRARLHVRNRRLGFFREGSHEICDAAATGQLSADTGAWLATAGRLIGARHLTGLTSIEIAENVDGSQRACHLEIERGVPVEPFSELTPGLTGLSAARSGGSRSYTLAGTSTVMDRLQVDAVEDGSFLLERDVRAFFQGNRFLLQPLLTHVVSFVDRGPVLDLYAGVGLFGLAAATAGCESVSLVEGDLVSGDSLRRNAEPFGARVRVASMSVEEFFSKEPGYQARTAIVDPPRTGLSRTSVDALLRSGVARLVYVSCDVATLARDLRLLLDGGFELRDVSGFDLFPNTAHIETVVVLERE
jgi:tRNA/tmRNA/rRNA uracil-C5-methylase (TrmA/RlmC/RlmD family)